ncbi:HD phosphohydrolase domain-containing protein [Capsaspora owczarzaki ATCC 30864]|uniref:HD phosphohydrolase domain-containing protein n=1 Tax=Capsaspora owczarzaki (strain ATCC 30864) TaxID=595528 RepID=A0A0D2WQH9_CAPO3|nr:HD phosphohydrolase domain-containing protein [Capsaspora owczarzaki ATCC 30864]
MVFPRNILDFVDTPQFQRLRDLKQLGTTQFVYPGASGATHSRFEHCMGVAHLGSQWMERFRIKQPELEITDREVNAVTLAGLCHDLGHGPFSHVFDGGFMPRARPNHKWHHEDWSEMMLNHLVDENYVDIEAEDLALIRDLIQGRAPNEGGANAQYRYMFDIVSNERNSVDVDKGDYLQRDAYNVGIKTDFDFSRLIHFSRVANDQICFQEKEVFNLYEMFHTRYSMFKRVYTHRVGKAIEHMFVDALLEADQYLQISASVDDPADYLNMTDSIVKEIERSKVPELEKSRSILRAVRKRNLYKFVDEVVIPQDIMAHLDKSRISPEEIASCQSDGFPVTASDVIVDWVDIHYGLKNGNNPVEQTRFFSRWEADETFNIPRDKVSFMLPGQYKDNILRVYCRDPDQMYAVQNAFKRFKQRSLPTSITVSAIPSIPSVDSPRKRRLIELS